jgi:hypothetical protein
MLDRKKGQGEGAPSEIVWCRVAVPAHRVRMRVRIYRNFEQNAKSV